jgi:hypothetical protein
MFFLFDTLTGERVAYTLTEEDAQKLFSRYSDHEKSILKIERLPALGMTRMETRTLIRQVETVPGCSFAEPVLLYGRESYGVLFTWKYQQIVLLEWKDWEAFRRINRS